MRILCFIGFSRPNSAVTSSMTNLMARLGAILRECQQTATARDSSERPPMYRSRLRYLLLTQLSRVLRGIFAAVADAFDVAELANESDSAAFLCIAVHAFGPSP